MAPKAMRGGRVVVGARPASTLGINNMGRLAQPGADRPMESAIRERTARNASTAGNPAASHESRECRTKAPEVRGSNPLPPIATTVSSVAECFTEMVERRAVQFPHRGSSAGSSVDRARTGRPLATGRGRWCNSPPAGLGPIRSRTVRIVAPHLHGSVTRWDHRSS